VIRKTGTTADYAHDTRPLRADHDDVMRAEPASPCIDRRYIRRTPHGRVAEAVAEFRRQGRNGGSTTQLVIFGGDAERYLREVEVAVDASAQ